MNFTNMYSQWSAAFRDITAAQFGLFMDGWKTMEKNMQDNTKADWYSIWKK